MPLRVVRAREPCAGHTELLGSHLGGADGPGGRRNVNNTVSDHIYWEEGVRFLAKIIRGIKKL